MYIHTIMKKILTFGASNSKDSINHQLAIWAANQLEDVKVIEIKLNDYEMPIYGIDKEKAHGIPSLAKDFKKLVDEADGIIVSFAEHNGLFSTAFKNVFDWISRLGAPIWSDKPMMIMSAAPGARGGASVLKVAETTLPYRGTKISGVFSLPFFGKNFNDGLVNSELLAEFNKQLSLFDRAVREPALA